MFFFLLVVLLAFALEISWIYRGERSNCVNEKWELLRVATTDPVFNENYRYHVLDASDDVAKRLSR